MAATFDAVSDSDLTRMTDRAYREAARCWQEARSATATPSVRQSLIMAAESADAYWRDLRDEQDRRLEEAAFLVDAEVLSADRYEVQPEVFDLPDGGTTTLPQEPKLPEEPGMVLVTSVGEAAVSPYVRRNLRQEQAAKARGAVR